ncbi:enoyl-CoA hydratase/isomerase family protein [Allosphingosinicella sp.]|uniref:enoyl-CoA hydratase/isomerase family protein n=1 Tax=Allosphingosinicella sp. TaxID=2823234 RepID=UPI002FC26561
MTKPPESGKQRIMFDLSVTAAIARLVLDRPKALNAIPVAGWQDLASAADEAVRADARILIVSGVQDGAFCAGADISDFDAFQADPEARTAFRKAMRHGLDTLRDLPIPTIALVEGACFGAGVALAMACDWRVAGPGARFAITPAKLGIAYPQEDVHRLVSLVGVGQAARLLFGAQSIDAEEAARIGLVEVAASGDVEDAMRDLASAVIANDPQSLRVLKRGVGLASLDIRQDDRQDRAFESLLGSDVLSDRLAAHRARGK